MKFTLIACFVATMTFVAVFNSADAAPQRYHVRPLPHRPPYRRSGPPRTIRVRRDAVVEGSLATNPVVGSDASLKITKGIGNQDTNLIGTAFASGNTKVGPVTTGAGLQVNHKDLSASISKTHTPGISDTLTKTAQANLFKTESNRLDGKIFNQETRLPNGFAFDKRGGSLELSNINGHSIGIAKETIPGIQSTLTGSATANLFRNNANSVDATLFGSRTKFENAFTTKDFGGKVGWSNIGGHNANIGLSRNDLLGDKLSFGGGANLFKSADSRTSLDLTAGGSRWLNGPLSGKTDFGGNLGLSHSFWG